MDAAVEAAAWLLRLRSLADWIDCRTGNKFGDAYGEWQRKVHREAMKPRRSGGSSGTDRRRGGSVGRGIASAAIGISGALTNPGLPANALEGDLQGSKESLQGIVETTQYGERDRRSRDMEQGTIDRGNRTGWSSQG